MLQPLDKCDIIESDDDDEEEELQELVKDESSDDSFDDEPVFEKKDSGDADKKDPAKMAVQQPRRKRFIPKYEVEGVHKIILGEETQMQIEVLVGTHINAQNPWKFVSKAKILDSIESSSESEFIPIQNLIAAYKDEEILLGYIVDESNDVDEFYVCCTTKARDHCKQQSEKFIKRQEKKLEKAIHKKPRPWTNLGSDQELLQLVPINTRPLMEMEIKTKFPTEYQPQKFQVRDSNALRDGYIELTPSRYKFNNIYRRRVDCASQITPDMFNRAAQTVLRYPQNMWTQSIADALGQDNDVDGGGDAGQTYSEKENQIEEISSEDEVEEKELPDDVGIIAFKNAMARMRRPSHIAKVNRFMTSKGDEMKSVIELNTVMDMYCNDYPNLVTSKTVDVYDSMTFQEYVCFTDVKAKDKYVSCAVFHPMWSGIVAISYADGSPNIMKTLGTRPDPIHRAVYGLNPVLIWSHIDSLIPKLYLESIREVKVLSFCPFNENILIGGCINGQIIIWDLTKKLENVEAIEVLSETREKYRIAMNAHMEWMKSVQDNSVVQYTALSNLMNSHYGPVTCIRWLSPNFQVTNTGSVEKMEDKKKSLIFLTGSEDGTILVWNLSVENLSNFEEKKVKRSKRVLRRPSGLTLDVSPFKVFDRNLQPCFKIILGIAGQPQTLNVQTFAFNPPTLKYIYTPRNQGLGRKYFRCQVIPQDEGKISRDLYCGSQHGEMRRVTWEGHKFNTGEVVNSEYCEIKYSCFIHDGIVSCTEKNPFINHITLTVGGKIFAIWSDKLSERPLIWKKRPYRLTDGAWSLYKPSLIFITTSEGDIETWDLLLRSDKPIAIQTLSGTMLTGVSLHTLPLTKNIIGVSDVNGSFRLFLNPPIFMIENPTYVDRMEATVNRELKVMQFFILWQEEWMKNNPEIILEIKRKEGALLAEKEEEHKRARLEEIKRLEEEAEAKRHEKMRVIGPEERWQKIIQKLIERTIAVKKRINRAELIEHEKPLRELETQRLEKERRMLEIMKNQKTIFNDTVAILFPEAIKKEEKVKKSFLSDDKEGLKRNYMLDYDNLKGSALKTVKRNPYKVEFSWDATLAEGKERRQSLNPYDDYVRLHQSRIQDELGLGKKKSELQSTSSAAEESEDENT